MLTYTIKVPDILEDTCVLPLSSDLDFINQISGFHSQPATDSAARSYSLSNFDSSWGFLDLSHPLASDRTFGITSGKPLIIPEGCSSLLAAGVATSSYHEDHPSRLPEQAATRADKIMQLLKMKEDALKLELELATT